MSSFLVERTPTRAALTGNSLSGPFQRAAAGSAEVSGHCLKSVSLVSRVSWMRATIISLSKLALVIVVNRFTVMR